MYQFIGRNGKHTYKFMFLKKNLDKLNAIFKEFINREVNPDCKKVEYFQGGYFQSIYHFNTEDKQFEIQLLSAKQINDHYFYKYNTTFFKFEQNTNKFFSIVVCFEFDKDLNYIGYTIENKEVEDVKIEPFSLPDDYQFYFCGIPIKEEKRNFHPIHFKSYECCLYTKIVYEPYSDDILSNINKLKKEMFIEII